MVVLRLKVGGLMIDIENNRIYNMDCFAGMKDMKRNSVDLIVTDPPYYIESLQSNQDLKNQTIRASSKNNIFQSQWDVYEDLFDYKHFTHRMLKEFKRILKPKGQVYIFCSYHHLDWMIKMIKDMGFRFYKPLVWYKPDTMGVFPNQYGCNYEPILWFRNDGNVGSVINNIGCGQRDVFVHNSTLISYRKECGFHPTPKPLKVIMALVKNSSNERDVVFDPFLGSGTTAVACKRLNRQYLGFEINKDYFSICEERLHQKPLFEFDKTEEDEKNEEKDC